MNNKKTSIIILILVVLGIWWFVRTRDGDTARVATPVVANEVEWSFDEVEKNESTGLPQTKVTAKVHGEKYDAGTYSGTCVERKKEELLEGQISGVLCYAAGFGDEVGVFKDARDYTLQVGEVQEPSAEGPEFRGNFRVLTIIK